MPIIRQKSNRVFHALEKMLGISINNLAGSAEEVAPFQGTAVKDSTFE